MFHVRISASVDPEVKGSNIKVVYRVIKRAAGVGLQVGTVFYDAD